MAQAAGYGLIGCGSFGQFCLEQYATLDNVRLVAVADANRQMSESVARRFSVSASSVEDLLARDEIDIVHIATPPATHRDLVLKAVSAGKHVLCEKPLATSVNDAKAMLAAAVASGRVLVVDFIMRYDPLNQAVGRILEQRLLGDPLHALMENDAADERLSAGHWFWDAKQSGGIFIEHAVHFFDLFETWLGPGEVLKAEAFRRPGAPQIVDQVQCLCRYGDGVLTSFYHGFHQADRMDRQEFRITCERGDIRLFEWLPTSLRIDAILLQSDVHQIIENLPNARVREIRRFSGDERRVCSRHKQYEVDGEFQIEADCGMTKTQLYGKAVRDLLLDQVKFILDPTHRRLLDESPGLRSLEMAEDATRSAGEIVAST